MRIKAVLRDKDILQMPVRSKRRILATMKKNLDRFVDLSSLLRVMGLGFEDRLTMLEALSDVDVHIWFLNNREQHIVYLSNGSLPGEEECAYQWQ